MELAATPSAEGPPEDTIKAVGCAHYKRKSKFVVRRNVFVLLLKQWIQINKTGTFIGKLFLESSSILFNIHLLGSCLFLVCSFLDFFLNIFAMCECWTVLKWA